MKKVYDDTIAKHYYTVAKEHGTSSTSTMADETTRALETEAISQFVGKSIRLRRAEGLSEPATIMVELSASRRKIPVNSSSGSYSSNI